MCGYYRQCFCAGPRSGPGRYFDPATKLCYAIGAVLGLVAGIKTYGKFSSGDPDTSKTAASWFFACIFLIVAATILRSFFL